MYDFVTDFHYTNIQLNYLTVPKNIYLLVIGNDIHETPDHCPNHSSIPVNRSPITLDIRVFFFLCVCVTFYKIFYNLILKKLKIILLLNDYFIYFCHAYLQNTPNSFLYNLQPPVYVLTLLFYSLFLFLHIKVV